MRAQIAAGATTPAAVFRANACSPQCGTCVPYVKDLITEARCMRTVQNDVPAIAAE